MEDAESYNARKDAFHAGNTGSSLLRVHAVTLVGFSTYLLWSSLSLRTRQNSRRQPVLEHLVFVLPLVAATTVLADHLLLLNAILVGLAVLSKRDRRRGAGTTPRHELGPPASPALRAPSRPASPLPSSPQSPIQAERDAIARAAHVVVSPRSQARLPGPPSSGPSAPLPALPQRPASLFRQPFVTVYRAQQMLITVICVLAVDFPAFPRDFGKTEVAGTSLMDLGVGSFVFSLGLVSALPVLRQYSQLSVARRLRTALRRSCGLLALGAARMLAVRGSAYPERVQEYGVHWNFFVTLGSVPLAGVLAEAIWPAVPFWLQGIACTLVHQGALSGGLSAWVADAPRRSLWTANKEGIASLPGYVAIFLLGLDCGLFALPPDPYFVDRAVARRVAGTGEAKAGKTASVLAGSSIAWWLAFAAARYGMQIEVSRQTANLAYVAWVAAFNTSFLLGCLLVQVGDVASAAPALLDAVNRNGLVLFLLANVATGLVNITMATIDAPDAVALLVLVVYTAGFTAAAYALRRFRLRF